MKKIVLRLSLIMGSLLFVSIQLFGANLATADDYTEDNYIKNNYTKAFTAGYVFKHHDNDFKAVYGHGMVNVITADGCYYFCKPWGVGAKLSYWRASGQTSFLKQYSLIQEVPLTFYLRRVKHFKCGLDVYGTLGAGVVWLKEHSYLGHINAHKGIGELELGVSYPMWRCLNFTSAVRYLFHKQRQCSSTSNSSSGDLETAPKIVVGGFDLRAGFEISF